MDTEDVDLGVGPMPEKRKTLDSLGSEYNFEANRIGQDYDSPGGGGKKVLTRVALRKPNKTEFFRTHLSFEYQTVLLEAPDGGGLFMVDRPLWSELESVSKPKLLIPFINRKSDISLWPLSLPDPNRPLLWTETAIEAAKLARTMWIRISANMDAGCYNTFEAEGVIPDPIWPDDIAKTILILAFKGRIIKDLDHPVVQKLRGKI